MLQACIDNRANVPRGSTTVVLAVLTGGPSTAAAEGTEAAVQYLNEVQRPDHSVEGQVER